MTTFGREMGTPERDEYDGNMVGKIRKLFSEMETF
jgi:hypothetical protein